VMLALDRYLGFHFFTNEAGGNMMMFINLIWLWGTRKSTFSFCRRSVSIPK
jgi:heme/copper-type cytochrome/quinol oxidase subunit 1